MAITLKCKKYHDIIIDSKVIIGICGKNYEQFLNMIKGDNVYYIDKKELLITSKDLEDIKTDLLNIEKKSIKELSNSDKRLLKYYYMLNSKASIILIDEPYLDLDTDNIKKVNNLLKRLVKEGKTIITGSNNSNVIYSLCKKVLLVNSSDLYYGDISVLTNKKILSKYSINEPDIITFINEVHKKNINLSYTSDIRDLIKDVYRNVSKK